MVRTTSSQMSSKQMEIGLFISSQLMQMLDPFLAKWSKKCPSKFRGKQVNRVPNESRRNGALNVKVEPKKSLNFVKKTTMIWEIGWFGKCKNFVTQPILLRIHVNLMNWQIKSLKLECGKMTHLLSLKKKKLSNQQLCHFQELPKKIDDKFPQIPHKQCRNYGNSLSQILANIWWK